MMNPIEGLDGWWAESYDGQNGFAIGTGSVHADAATQEDRDARSLHDLLERTVVPLFFERDATLALFGASGAARPVDPSFPPPLVRSIAVQAHKPPVSRAPQELRLNKRIEHRLAGHGIQPPQPLRLRQRQSQAWHFEVLPVNAQEHVLRIAQIDWWAHVSHRQVCPFHGAPQLHSMAAAQYSITRAIPSSM